MSEHIQKRSVWIVVLAVVAILISLASVGFSTFVYFNTPKQINNYVRAHNKELKGDKGDAGPQGSTGFTGRAGAAGADGYTGSLYCNTYTYTPGSSSTTCN